MLLILSLEHGKEASSRDESNLPRSKSPSSDFPTAKVSVIACSQPRDTTVLYFFEDALEYSVIGGNNIF